MKAKGIPHHRHYMYMNMKATEERVIEEHLSGPNHERYKNLITQEMRDDCVYFGQKATAKEIPQCPCCKLYTDDPEHWCGSVALVTGADGPRVWKYIFDSIFFINTTIL